jgi:hypothetical protein
MRRRSVLTGIAAVFGAVAGLAQAVAAPKSYKYRCPRCQLIQEYGQPGVKKCPKDGFTMIKVS